MIEIRSLGMSIWRNKSGSTPCATEPKPMKTIFPWNLKYFLSAIS